MEGGGDLKVATVDVDSIGNMATLPVGKTHSGSDLLAEKNNVTNKEMELRNVQPKPIKRTSLYIITSFIYAKLLIAVCVAYVISDVVTNNLPLYYYEGFFTYLYGVSILFLLYVFCFLLQESSCCSGNREGNNKEIKLKKQVTEKKEKDKTKGTKTENSKTADKEKDKAGTECEKTKVKDKKCKQKKAIQQENIDLEAGVGTKYTSKRKVPQNNNSYGSFFLRVGAIAFGLGTMIYTGLEFGSFFEVPVSSSCYHILRGVNPVLQMIFTFMQMYFVFMNSRLNIHKFRVLARFGLMHIFATNICVWIRTSILEYLKEITTYYQNAQTNNEGLLGERIRNHVLRNPFLEATNTVPSEKPLKSALVTSGTTHNLIKASTIPLSYATTALPATTYNASTTTQTVTQATITSTLPEIISTTTESIITEASTISTSTTTTPAPSPPMLISKFFNYEHSNHSDSKFSEDASNLIMSVTSNSITAKETNFSDSFDFHFNNINASSLILPQALTSNNITDSITSTTSMCERVNIMGTIVQDSAPYLFPFIIEYSLIGATVAYIMWKHIGRNTRLVTEEDLERRLEIMLSRKAVAMAQVQHGRLDCVGSSKGLFFGLLLLVGSLICLILFFVLIRHPDLNMLAIYLGDVSHCALMAISIIAIIIGFIRVQSLKFRIEEQGDLNDILLRVSAFGLFLYAIFSVIAGSLGALTNVADLLVMITGVLSIMQVVLQLLFIADVARRRVYLPEHDRSKPGRQVVTFLLICNVTFSIIYTFEMKKVEENPVQLEYYGFLTWAIVQRITQPLCIFHRFHSAVTLAEIWKTTYKPRFE